MRFSISQITSRIDNFQESFRFDKIVARYLKELEQTEVGGKGNKTIHVLVIFDSVTPTAGGRYSVAPFSHRSKSVKCELYVRSTETVERSEHELISDLGSHFLALLQRLGEMLPAANREEVARLERLVMTTTSQFAPGTEIERKADQEHVDTHIPNPVRIILQFPESEFEDFDKVTYLEGALALAIESIGEIDGHDIGLGTVNFYLEGAAAMPIVDSVKALVSTLGIPGARLFEQSDTSAEPQLIWEGEKA